MRFGSSCVWVFGDSPRSARARVMNIYFSFTLNSDYCVMPDLTVVKHAIFILLKPKAVTIEYIILFASFCVDIIFVHILKP